MPGPSSFANLIAPATLIPLLVPKLNPSFSINLKIVVNASKSSMQIALSMGASLKLAVILEDPIPSVIEIAF